MNRSVEPNAGSATRIALRVAYDGAAFNGWQTQPTRDAAQDALESALAAVAGLRVVTVCAGRTDAGVHALAQVVHFDSPVTRPQSAWVRGVNAHLPASIAVQQAIGVDDRFHARYAALRRGYCYLIYRGATRHPLYAHRAGWVFRGLDTSRIAEAATALLGEHDFSAFRSSQCQARSPIRTIERIELSERGPLLVLEIRANAFLHHMVRNIVGALVWVGLGRRPTGWVAEILAGRDRTLGAPTFSAQGLYLCGVQYPPQYDIGSWPASLPPLASR
ncbi:MAG: tRNA pseudouridine(38-40) synthase TruA [Burkholderiaceae bacterium]|nr:tRNA pseudouridine(38-40) synthase TruA [Burkholderiaceae bacterium]